jgi:MoxR-like ATPase
MPWEIFSGTGTPRPADTGAEPGPAWRAIPPPPPWRRGAGSGAAPAPFLATPELVEAVNAALHLRRPLLLTGPPGSGKSSVIDLIAEELALGPVLRWHVTSKSALRDALFDYDALGRLQATQVADAGADAQNRQAGTIRPTHHPKVEDYVTLGPLGTALASPDQPRAVLIDEIDKSDLDLHGDLLNVLEHGEFDIPPLQRDGGDGGREAATIRQVRGADRAEYPVSGGVVRTQHFPVIVLTSNGDRTFPAPFLRRCIQFHMPTPTADFLAAVVGAHLGSAAAERERALIHQFRERLSDGHGLAMDQLLNIVYLTTGDAAPRSDQRARLEQLLLADLGDR